MLARFKKYTSTLGGLVISMLIAFGVIILSMISYFYIYLPAVTNHNETITVPDVVGMKFEELENFLVKKDLRYEVNDSAYSDSQPPLAVLKQYPSAGAKVKENRVIYISVNRITPPTVPVPNLIEGSLINADAVLKSNELKRGRIELVRGTFLQFVRGMKYKGHPIQPGERVPKGSVIDLVVEDGGSNSISLPDLVGYEFEDAKFVITGSSLNFESILVGDTTGVGVKVVVLKQKPDANQNIKVGDIVKIWIGVEGTEVSDEDDEEIPDQPN